MMYSCLCFWVFSKSDYTGLWITTVYPVTGLDEDLQSTSVYCTCRYDILSCRHSGKLYGFSVFTLLFTLAPVAVGQLWDSRRSEPSQKHSIQSLPATLSGTQTGPSQCCFFWKTHKVNFYGATNQEIRN